MKDQDFQSSDTDSLIPRGEAARQAIDSLRGYAYQVTAAALAWLDVDEKGKIYLEVAEDYAVVAAGAINAVQVKDTQNSGSVTLNTESVREAISSFVRLKELNQGSDIQLRYLTTSEIGTERTLKERPAGMAGLNYWRSAAKGADVAPLRQVLDSEKFPDHVREFVRARADEDIRRELLRKIHWDCGNPDLASLRKEFQDRFVVIGRDTFELPAQDALRISDHILHHVLTKSIESRPIDRVLTRSDLLTLTDNASRVSISATTLSKIATSSSELLASILAGPSPGAILEVKRPIWLIDGDELPTLHQIVGRQEIESQIEQRLRESGACFVTGASGVGKTSVSRAAAQRLGGGYCLVDFRNNTAEETKARLAALLARLGGLRVQVVILEDLNTLNDAAVSSAAARVFNAMNRRDISSITTLYTAPTSRTLMSVGHQLNAIVDCPYFSEQESASLVELQGGDPGVWGKLAHASGAFGHPQLVHAFVAGLAIRQWPMSEFSAIIKAGLSSGDVNAEREAARRSLISVLPKPARDLLYRLSMTIGSFNRTAALDIAGAPPPIDQAGEALDTLIGPWLETTGRNSYRVSPLAAQSGSEMLLPDEQRRVHHTIASHLSSGRSVDASDIDRILLHAMLGKNHSVLATMTFKLLTADDNVTAFLAENSTLLRMFQTEELIYPENLYLSTMLRLVQFRVVAAGPYKDNIGSCVRALLRESADTPHEAQSMVELMCLMTILATMGIANHVDNWIELIIRFHALLSGDATAREVVKGLEENPEMPGSTVGILFAIGSSNLISVAMLEGVIDQLDTLGADERSMILSTVGQITSDFSVFINTPWVNERDTGLDARDAAERYRRMAERSRKWGFRTMAIQCWIARAVMLDEYAQDFEGALSLLAEASTELGDDVLIERARAKVYWRAQDHQSALSILRRIADKIGQDNHIERAFALREAAISAANCNDWALAGKWFHESNAAASASKLPKMQAMSVGLVADASVSAFKSGDVGKCLTGLTDALTKLDGISPSDSLQGAHCHHLVRHVVLWLKSSLEGRQVVLDGEAIFVGPGMCSNPEPKSEIAQRPLGSIDIAWYMVSECELIARANVGIGDELKRRMSGRTIPMMEIGIRLKRLELGIEDRSAATFSCHVLDYVEAIACLSRIDRESNGQLDLINPQRASIDPLTPIDASSSYNEYITDAILAYAVSCACAQQAAGLENLAIAMVDKFGPGVMGWDLLSRARSSDPVGAATSFDDAILQSAMELCNAAHSTPREHCVAGVRFLIQAQRSNYRKILVPILAQSQRSAWKRIIASERTQLIQPYRTVPSIEASLSSKTDDERFLSSLLLSAADAVGVALPNNVQERLRGTETR